MTALLNPLKGTLYRRNTHRYDMEIRDRIISTLQEAAPDLRLLPDDVYLFGSSASILSGVEINGTQDIDLLTTTRDAELLKNRWADKDLHVEPKPSGRFRSRLSRYRFELMDIEISGGMEIYVGNAWQPFRIDDCRVADINGLSLHIPTLEEQKRILTLFNRPKDLEKISLIDEQINKSAMQELVTVKVFNFHNDLHVVKSFLESEGIHCFVKDEYINTVNPFYTNATGGIKLQVPSGETEDAIRLLMEGGFARPEDYELPKELQVAQRITEWIKSKFK